MIVLPKPVSRLRELRPLVTRNEQHVGLYAYSIYMKATQRHCTHEVLQGARDRDGFTGATQKSPHVHTSDTPRTRWSSASVTGLAIVCVVAACRTQHTKQATCG